MYRRHIDSPTWHFSPNCSQWPNQFNFIIRDTLPLDSERCVECMSVTQRPEAKNDISVRPQSPSYLNPKIN